MENDSVFSPENVLGKYYNRQQTAFHAGPATAPRADGASLLKKVQNATLALLEYTNALRSTWELATRLFSEQRNISN